MNIPLHTWFSPLLFSLFLLSATHPLTAQELAVEVTVDRSRVNSSSLSYMDDFAEEVEAYLNEYNWTEQTFRERERIEADLQIVLLSADNNSNFQANLVVRSQRPIYNHTRQTTVLLANDESWSFRYTPNRGLVHDELQFDAVTTLLDFYAYIIIGYDFDTFAELGGTPYFSEAENVLSLAQTTANPGWSRSGTRRGRAQLAAGLLNPGYQNLRRALYTYHRLGLDRFVDAPDIARRSILEALVQIRDAQQQNTDDFLFDLFFNAKYRELVSVFEDAPADLRLEAYNLLSQLDQSHLTEYAKLQ